MEADRKSLHRILVSILGAALILTIELVKSHRSNFWVGFNAEGWQGALAAFSVYLIVFLVVTTILDISLQVRLRHHLFRSIVAFAGAATLFVLVLVQFVPSYPVGVAMLSAGMLLCVIVLNSISESRGWASRNGILLLAIVAITISWIAMEVVGTLSIVDPARHTLVTLVLVGAAALAFGTGFVLMLFTPTQFRAILPYGLLVLCGAGLIGLWSPYFGSGRAAPPAQPSILLITCDALRADFLSVYGGQVQTPNFERIQDQGTTFERAYSLAPWTLPSVNSLYGSQYPRGLTPGAPLEQWRREVTAYAFDDRQRTLAQRLSAEGYATALFTGNGLVGQAKSTRRGFDSFVRLGHHLEGWTGFWAYVPYFRKMLAQTFPRFVEVRPVDTTKVLTAYVKGFLNTQRGNPVFIWLHYMDPHSPYDPPRKYRTDTGPWPLFCPRNPHWGTPQRDADGTLTLAPDEEDHAQMLYESEIRYVDAALGEVFETMHKTGHNSNAIVCVTADHGEELWDHGEWGHGHSLYEEVIRVPLLMSAPGLPVQRIHEPVSHIDLIPTLAALAHTDADPHWQGSSLTPELLQPTESIDRPAFARASNTLNPDGPIEMVTIKDHKLIHRIQSETVQLFDLSEDAVEQHDLSSANTARAGALLYPLQLWNRLFPPDFDEGGTASNDEVLEELRSLGYVN